MADSETLDFFAPSRRILLTQRESPDHHDDGRGSSGYRSSAGIHSSPNVLMPCGKTVARVSLAVLADRMTCNEHEPQRAEKRVDVT